MTMLTIIIPAYNEEATVERILDRVRMAPLLPGVDREIIVIDDASIDRTADIVRNYSASYPSTTVRLFSHPKNRGKGAAIHTGIREAQGDWVIIQDADLEYDPNELSLLLEPMANGHADVVFGSRFMGGHPHRVLFFWHYLGNQFLTMLSNAFTNLNLTDMETCYKLFKREIIQKIPLVEERFGFEPEVTARLAQIPNIRIYEVGISYYGRTYQEGKKIGWRDGFRAIYCIVRYNLFPKLG
jgi:glycosyltransferase involved in cell wall biosynthesis